MIGCGRISQHYRKILLSGVVKNFEVAACHDINAKHAEDIAGTFGALVYDKIEPILKNREIDLFLVLTPSGLHYEHTRKILESGHHVLVEKPATLIPEHSIILEKLAKKLNLYCGAVFQNRYNPAILALKGAFDKNRFGKIITASVRLRWCRYQEYYEDGWHGTWKMDGGVINQQAIHHIDALNWICGPVKRCCAHAATRVNLLEAEDTMTAILEFENGAAGTIEVTTAARPKDFEASISIIGDRGMAVIGGLALNKIEQWNFLDPEPGDNDVPKCYSQEVENGYGLGHGPLLNDVLDSLKQNRIDKPITIMDSYNTIQFVHALYASVECNGWVNLSDNPVSVRLGRSD